MTVQLIIMATRRPDSDADYAAYSEVAVPIMLGAGGTFTGRYRRIDDLAGQDGPEGVAIMDFEDEAAVRAAITSPEYEATIPDRDKAFERFNIILAAAPPA
ncbi:MAG: DUF1330 domain-containing protein [Acidimicrobiia bacterium]